MTRPARTAESHPHMTEEQRASADACDQLTDIIIESANGLSIGIVVGACFNVLDHASNFLPVELRRAMADRMRIVADDIAAKQDAPGGH
jgi:hypothetical protein